MTQVLLTFAIVFFIFLKRAEISWILKNTTAIHAILLFLPTIVIVVLLFSI